MSPNRNDASIVGPAVGPASMQHIGEDNACRSRARIPRGGQHLPLFDAIVMFCLNARLSFTCGRATSLSFLR